MPTNCCGREGQAKRVALRDWHCECEDWNTHGICGEGEDWGVDRFVGVRGKVERARQGRRLV